MSSINAGTSIIDLTDHLCTVLKEHMPGRLLEYSEELRTDYQLRVPEQYIDAPSDPMDAFRDLNVDAVAAWVVTEGPSTFVRWEADSGERARGDQSTRVRVAVLAREPAGMRLPMLRGRQLLLKEWVRRRAEYYKAAVLDVVSQHGELDTILHQVLPVANDAAAVAVEGLGITSQAAVIFECRQDILIRRNNWS